MGIIGKGEDVNAKRPESGATLLIEAAEKGDAALANTLLLAGAEPDGRGYSIQSTPLTRARNAGVAAVLLRAGANANAVDGVGTTPLSWFASLGDAEGTKQLLAHGAAAKPEPPADPPLLNAADVASARLIMEAGADVNQASRTGETPLMHAAARANEPLAKLYLDSGAKVQAKDSKGNTAFHFARSAAIVSLLCRAGADPRALNDAGETPLFDILHNARTVRAMIEAGVPVDTVSAERHVTALQLLLGDRREDDNAILALIRAGAGVAVEMPETKDSPLHQAVLRPSRKRVEIVRALLKAGADPACMNAEGKTPAQCIDNKAADAAQLKALLP